MQPLPEALWGGAASGHGKDGGVVSGRWHVYPEMAAAGLWTTPSDLALAILFIEKSFRQAEMANRLISSKQIQEMLTVQIKDMGLGPMLSNTEETIEFYHPGVNEGFQSFWKGKFSRAGGPVKGYVLMMNTLGAKGDLRSEIDQLLNGPRAP
jgi:hypothetical protein